jgi:hypothetical protein
MVSTGLFRTLARRWRASIVGLFLTAALCALSIVLVPAKYEIKAVVLLYPPNTNVTSVDKNPILGFGSLIGLNDVLAQSLSGNSTLAELRAQGFDGSYTVTADPTAVSPLLNITGEDRTAAGANMIVTRLLNLVSPTLVSLQQSVGITSSTAYITAKVLTITKPQSVRQTQIRAVIGAVAIGVLLTLLLVASSENLANRRARRRLADRPPDNPSAGSTTREGAAPATSTEPPAEGRALRQPTPQLS